MQAIPGTSSDTTHAELNPIENTVITNTLTTSEENQEAARDIREQNNSEEPIDLRTTGTPPQDTTIDLREEDSIVNDWNATDVLVTEKESTSNNGIPRTK